MGRPKKCRWVETEPGVTFFKPRGIPLRSLQQIVITVDELEAMRQRAAEEVQTAAALADAISRACPARSVRWISAGTPRFAASARTSATRAARAGWVFTDGADASA